MEHTKLKLYAPFILVVLVQGLLVLAVPSPSAQDVSTLDGLSADGFAAGESATTAPTTLEGQEPVTSGGGADPGRPATNLGTANPAPAPTPTSATRSSAPSSQPSGSPSPAPPAGDTTHCIDGRQSDVIYHAPPCAPRWAGDNGGATYPGVSGDTIKVIDFQCESNDQINALLASQGLASTLEEQREFRDAATTFLNSTYEFYGRELVIEPVIGDCVVSPPDYAEQRQAAEEVARLDPFIVNHPAGGPAPHDVWARNGIISLGGSHQPTEFYAGRRPFRWDHNIDGTQTADGVVEYYCKKLAGSPASNAGITIHTEIPGGRTAPRQPGIVSLDNGNGAHLPSAERMAERIGECTGLEVPVFTYPSDINRASEISRAIVAGLISAKVTTVICHCDPIAPTFFTNEMTQNRYFPEHVTTGAGLIDIDKFGRLYDNQQWQHAFGLSHLTQVRHEESDATKVWRAAGRDGEPCNACNLYWDYYSMIGSMVQLAGPNLNPLSVEAGMQAMAPRGGWAQTGGDPDIELIQYGPDDYTALSDFREVRWSNTAPSPVDAQPGSYVALNDGRRYALGEQGTSFDVEPAAT